MLEGWLPGPIFRSIWNQRKIRLVPNQSNSEKYDRIFRSENPIVFFIILLIWLQTQIYLVPNQSENGKYNLILIDLTRISWINQWFFSLKHFCCDYIFNIHFFLVIICVGCRMSLIVRFDWLSLPWTMKKN